MESQKGDLSFLLHFFYIIQEITVEIQHEASRN